MSNKGLFGHSRQPAELEQRRSSRVFVLISKLSEQAAWPEAVCAVCFGGWWHLQEEEEKLRLSQVKVARAQTTVSLSSVTPNNLAAEEGTSN